MDKNMVNLLSALLQCFYCDYNSWSHRDEDFIHSKFSPIEINYKELWTHKYIDGLMQAICNSTANALELRLSCIDPSIWYFSVQHENLVITMPAADVPAYNRAGPSPCTVLIAYTNFECCLKNLFWILMFTLHFVDKTTIFKTATQIKAFTIAMKCHP